MSSDTDNIRAANRLQQHQAADYAFISPGVAALGPSAVKRLVQTIATFDDFYRATDSNNRPDRGVFEFDSVEVCFRLNDCDQALDSELEVPASVIRSVTLMLATGS